MQKVYISGRITGLLLNDAAERFQKAEDYLIAQGYSVINPMKLGHKPGASWAECMALDLKELITSCNAIFFLNNWQDSTGATLERELAKLYRIDEIENRIGL